MLRGQSVSLRSNRNIPIWKPLLGPPGSPEPKGRPQAWRAHSCLSRRLVLAGNRFIGAYPLVIWAPCCAESTGGKILEPGRSNPPKFICPLACGSVELRPSLLSGGLRVEVGTGLKKLLFYPCLQARQATKRGVGECRFVGG